jgi:hypothetical protein
MTTTTVAMTAMAREQLFDLDWQDRIELGGGLYGHKEAGRLVITHCIEGRTVEAGPGFLRQDAGYLRQFDCEGHRLLGDFHSHPTIISEAREGYSETDLEGWTTRARGLKHDYVGLIVNPRREVPSRHRGFTPDVDWAYPKLSAYLVTPSGKVTPIRMDVQPMWLADLEAQVRLPNPEHQELAKGIR